MAKREIDKILNLPRETEATGNSFRRYNPWRQKNVYFPSSSTPFKLSRSRIEQFIRCPRCFYIDRRRGISPPPGIPFNLNKCVDFLLKKEFDIYRSKGVPHPDMVSNGIGAIPYYHPDLEIWRTNFTGITHHHLKTNFIVSGAIDDLWIDSKGHLIVVDYKATSQDGVPSLDAEWKLQYKRQMEVYQWLLRMNGFKVSKRGYFVYCNAISQREAFEGQLVFDKTFIPYDGSTVWIEDTLKHIKKCLDSDTCPDGSETCAPCLHGFALRRFGSPLKEQV